MMNNHFLFTSKHRAMVFLVLVGLLTGCTSWGDRLSGTASHPNPSIEYPKVLEHVKIGLTTKEEVRELVGNPTDLQVSSVGGSTRESWAYAETYPKIHPLQYIPGVGVFALSNKRPPPSFAISFSSKGVVDGIVLREVQPSGADQTSKDSSEHQAWPMSYGKNNPLSHHSTQEGSVESEIFKD